MPYPYDSLRFVYLKLNAKSYDSDRFRSEESQTTLKSSHVVLTFALDCGSSLKGFFVYTTKSVFERPSLHAS